MATLRLEIVTPEAKTYSEDVDMVTIPGLDGEFGILPLHVPLITALKPGELRILRRRPGDVSWPRAAGFAEVLPDRVSILTDMAVRVSGHRRSSGAGGDGPREGGAGGQELGTEAQAEAEAAIARSMAQLHLKRHRHAASNPGVR